MSHSASIEYHPGAGLPARATTQRRRGVRLLGPQHHNYRLAPDWNMRHGRPSWDPRWSRGRTTTGIRYQGAASRRCEYHASSHLLTSSSYHIRYWRESGEYDIRGSPNMISMSLGEDLSNPQPGCYSSAFGNYFDMARRHHDGSVARH